MPVRKIAKQKRFLTIKAMARTVCRRDRRWGLLLALVTPSELKEIKLAAPYLSEEQADGLIRDGWLLLLFDHRDSALQDYYNTAGANGSAEIPHNLYSGPAKIIAWVIAPNGETQVGGHS